MITIPVKKWKTVLVTVSITALVLVVSTGSPLAAVDCASIINDIDAFIVSGTSDTDGDGYLDWEECKGLELISDSYGTMGTSFAIDYPSCFNNPSLVPKCLDPDSLDVLIIFLRTLPFETNVPTDPGLEEYFDPFAYVPFIGVTPHEIAELIPGGDIADRVIVDRSSAPFLDPLGPEKDLYQKALRIHENTASAWGNDMGIADQGPAWFNTVEGVVYTNHIINFIRNEYFSSGVTEPSNLRETVIEPYMMHTFAHEVGHMFVLRTPEQRNIGFHFKTREEKMMSQSIAFSSKGKKLSWYISDVWHNDSVTDKVLK